LEQEKDDQIVASEVSQEWDSLIWDQPRSQ